MNKTYNFNFSLSRLIFFVSTLSILFNSDLSNLSAEDFDPNSVRSADCKPGGFRCGYIPSPVEVQENIPLSRNFNNLGTLPSSFDLSPNMPPVGSQGRQNSCVAWATGYAMKSYLAKKNGKVPSYDPPFAGGSGQNIFSPAFIYNQQNGGKDAGLYYYKTLDFLQENGVATWKSMPYKDSDYLEQPSKEAQQEALEHRIKSYTRLNHKKPDDIKQVISAGNVVLVGIIIDDAFYKLKGNEVYDASGGQAYGGHGMVIVGYDDNKKSKSGKKGAFKLQNSWGTNWGDKGFGWISYSMLARVGQETYAMIDQAPQTNTSISLTPSANLSLLPPNEVHASRGEFSDKITLTWIESAGAVTYSIQRKDSTSNSDFIDLGYSNSTSFTDANLAPSSTFLYKVSSISESEVSSWSKQAEGFTNEGNQSTGRLEKVIGVKFSSIKEKTINHLRITWSEVSDASGYIISKNTNGSIWKDIAKTKTTEFIDKSFSAKGTHVYRICASKNNKKAGDWSDSYAVNIESPKKIPETITSIQATDGNHSDKIIISWNESPGSTGYYLFRFNENYEIDGEVATTNPYYEDKDPKVLNGKYFYYTAYAYNEIGYSSQSEFTLGRIQTDQQKRSAGLSLDPPQNVILKFDPSVQSVNLKWDPVKDVFEYYVYRKPKKPNMKDSKFTFVNSVKGSQTSYSEKFPGNSGDLYFYTIRSKSEFGSESKNSNLTTAYWNISKVQIKKRSISLDEIPSKLLGIWTGSYWNPKSGPKNLSLEIASKNQGFYAVLKINDKIAKQFTGIWIQGSTGFRTNGFQLDLSNLEGNANVRFDSIPELEEGIEFSFTKE